MANSLGGKMIEDPGVGMNKKAPYGEVGVGNTSPTSKMGDARPSSVPDRANPKDSGNIGRDGA